MTTKPVRILGIGKDARFHAMLQALGRSRRRKELHALSEVDSPGIREEVEDRLRIGKTDDLTVVKKLALSIKPDFAIISPEEPLFAGVVDTLKELGIPSVGPTKEYARLEWSKSFTRELLSKYGIPGNVEYKVFRSLDGLERYLRERRDFVVKPDGLTAGKGVKVFGEHLHSLEEAVQYAASILKGGHSAVVIEEKLEGEEFSYQSFCDGRHVKDTVAVQDHKRAYEGDSGPNTGGMGSYSCEDRSLPFLRKQDIQQASQINMAVAEAVRKEIGGDGFKGILYGGFMITKNGLKVLEYNARFGDPEAMNVLPLLETDFIDVCEAIISGTLDKIRVSFRSKATVCKYVVPDGYPDKPKREVRIDNIPASTDNLKVYYAAVNQKADGLYSTGSRAIAVVGIGNNLAEAEQVAEDAASKVNGPVRHRKDIGTSALIQRRIDHVNRLLGEKKSIAANPTVLQKAAVSL
jgi:phosphoribosylamine--glycine ligase